MVILSPEYQWWYPRVTGNRWNWVWLKLLLWRRNINMLLWCRHGNINNGRWYRC